MNNSSCLSSEIIPNSAPVSFSVIMASYNRKYCIDHAIQSVLSQNYNDFELLIIDDGSVDGTIEHVETKYRQEIATGSIRLIPSRHVGLSAVRNIGLDQAKHEWICYLDTDNRMLPAYFQTFNRYINANPECQCFYAKMRLRTSKKVIGKPFYFFELVRSNFIDIGTLVHSNALYHELGGQDVNLTSLEDWDLAIRYTAIHKPCFIDAVVLDYEDAPGDRITEHTKHEDSTRLIMSKNISIKLGFLAENLYSPEFFRWAVRNLLKVFFIKMIRPLKTLFGEK